MPGNDEWGRFQFVLSANTFVVGLVNQTARSADVEREPNRNVRLISGTQGLKVDSASPPGWSFALTKGTVPSTAAPM